MASHSVLCYQSDSTTQNAGIINTRPVSNYAENKTSSIRLFPITNRALPDDEVFGSVLYGVCHYGPPPTDPSRP
jgi:hypothetical protein